LACHDIFGHPTMKIHNLSYGLFEIGDRSWIEFFNHRYYYGSCILCPLLVSWGSAPIVVFYYFIVWRSHFDWPITNLFETMGTPSNIKA
jgi:hypothetical protein